MAVKRVDVNRTRKTYPFIRRVPVYKYQYDTEQAGSNVIYEVASVSFSGTDQVTHNFTTSFSSAPKVTATAKDDNVNVYISAVSTSSVTINASAAFTGTVEIHAIQSP